MTSKLFNWISLLYSKALRKLGLKKPTQSQEPAPKAIVMSREEQARRHAVNLLAMCTALGVDVQSELRAVAKSRKPVGECNRSGEQLRRLKADLRVWQNRLKREASRSHRTNFTNERCEAEIARLKDLISNYKVDYRNKVTFQARIF